MTSDSFQNMVLANVFEGIRQLRDENLYDLTVCVKGKEFPCHRVILASVSKHFRKIIKPYSKKILIRDKDVSSYSFKLLLKLLYDCKDVITETTIQDFWKMSLYFKIDFLAQHCERMVSLNLRPENCVDVWQIAQKYSRPDLADKSCNMAVENIDIVVKTNQLTSIPKSMLLILLSLQQKLTMDLVCRTILSWVRAEQRKRLIHLTELLPFISFPLLSSHYLSDLLEQDLRQFGDALKESITEGQKFHLKAVGNKDIESVREILARQSLRLSFPGIRSRAVVVSADHVFTFDLQTDDLKYYALARVPRPINLHFGSCAWHNEIYLCGGELFAVYKPGNNRWEVMPDLPTKGRERHAMAAISSKIYVLGGVSKNSNLVSKYDILSGTWSNVSCQLPSPVQDASAAVLGHRIYLFGGANGSGKTDLVQCVDTLGEVSYVAGTLPSPGCKSRAISNGGIIYVVLPSGKVLQMLENFYLADQTEKTLAIKTKKGEHNEVTNHTTIMFREIATFPARHEFGAYLEKGEMFVYGGRPKTGGLVCSTLRINIATGEIKTIKNTAMEGPGYFDLHVVNVPQVHIQTALKAVQDTPGRRNVPTASRNAPGPQGEKRHPSSQRAILDAAQEAAPSKPVLTASRSTIPLAVTGPSSQSVNRAEASQATAPTSSVTERPRQTTVTLSTVPHAHTVTSGSHVTRPQGEKRHHSSEATSSTGQEKQTIMDAAQEAAQSKPVLTASRSTIPLAVTGPSSQSVNRAEANQATVPTSSVTERPRQTTGTPSAARHAHTVTSGSHVPRPQGEKRHHSSEATSSTGQEKQTILDAAQEGARSKPVLTASRSTIPLPVTWPSSQSVNRAEASQGTAPTSSVTERPRQTTGTPSAARHAHTVTSGSHNSRPQCEKRHHFSERTSSTGREKQTILDTAQEGARSRPMLTASRSTIHHAVPRPSSQSVNRAEASQGRAPTSSVTERPRQTTGTPSSARRAHTGTSDWHIARPQGEKRHHSSERTSSTGREKQARYRNNSTTGVISVTQPLEWSGRRSPRQY